MDEVGEGKEEREGLMGLPSSSKPLVTFRRELCKEILSVSVDQLVRFMVVRTRWWMRSFSVNIESGKYFPTTDNPDWICCSTRP